MSETTPPPEAEVACANCGRRFVGTWCPDCGQEERDLDRSLRDFLRDLLSDLLAFDARIWHTAPLLVTNPGSLARDYVDGRRARYVPPVRLYVFLAAVFFTVLALTRGGPVRFGAVETPDVTTIVSIVGFELRVSDQDPGESSWWGRAASRAVRDVEGVNSIVVATLSYVHFLLLPVFALYLKALWRPRWYLEHLVLAAYLGSFALLAGILTVGLYGLAGNPEPPGPAAEIAYRAWDVALLVMAYRALRAMYDDSRGRTFAKLVVLFFACASTTVLSVVGIFGATLWLVY